jgi:hypothetical protein
MALSKPRARIDIELLCDASSSWGHASGWAQLSGTRRTVSCLVVGIVRPTGLAALFHKLSDELTEAGYPWEVVMVDAGAGSELSDLLDQWRQRQGFHRIAMPQGTSAQSMLSAALEEARGDAVLLMSPHLNALAIDVSDMISCWLDGTEVVRSPYRDRPTEEPHQPDVLQRSLREVQALNPRDLGADGAPEISRHGALLLDKRIVEMLLSRD